MCYYDGNKEVNLKIFKLKFAYLHNEIDEQLFEHVFGHTFVALADKLISTTNKEENKIIINDIKKDRDILYKHDNFNNYVIQPSNKPIDLTDAAKPILNFNEIIQLDLVWKQKHEKHKMNAYVWRNIDLKCLEQKKKKKK